ncbi:MAG: PRC-barrel domain containing protein [Betaproteobacteria bacterium]|nr:MAG: PRC-barrel domain containing protein [Betaproteobacteria bacterium]
METPTSRTSGTAPSSGGAPIVGAERRTSDGPGPEVMDAKTLIGDSVVNASAEKLYAVLSFGGFLGMGAKLFAIPWSALTLDAGEQRFILNVPKEKLENAPGFDKDHWPSMADSTWATEIHAYYEVRPYWDDELSDDTGNYGRDLRDPRTTAGSSINPKTY